MTWAYTVEQHDPDSHSYDVAFLYTTRDEEYTDPVLRRAFEEKVEQWLLSGSRYPDAPLVRLGWHEVPG